jgi:hypothetical protein
MPTAELARLADDDRAGADDEHGMDVGAFGHRRIYDLRFMICDLERRGGQPSAAFLAHSKTARIATRIEP